MKIKMSTLRKIIREEMERNLRWTAGIMAGGLGLNNPTTRGTDYRVPPGLGTEAPPGLGPDDTETENEENTNEEEESLPRYK